MMPKSPSIRVTEVGEYVRYHGCDRRFKLNYKNYSAIPKQHPSRGPLFENLLDPVLQESGRNRENECAERLMAAEFQEIATPDPEARNVPWSFFIEQLQTLQVGQQVYSREVAIESTVGAFDIRGQIDFVLLQWQGQTPTLRLVESKASRRDQTYHRIQVALYRLLVANLLTTAPVTVAGQPLLPENVDCVVVRIEEATDQMQDFIEMQSFDLSLEASDLLELLKSDGNLQTVLQTPVDDLTYTINGKCSDCVFAVHCLPESARQRRLELLGMQSPLIRVLKEAGIHTIDDLADLDIESEAAIQIRNHASFTDNLARLQTVAQTRRLTLPNGDVQPDGFEVTALPVAAQSQLPEHEIDGQRLVRIYLVVDYDYVENRIGGLSAHLTTSAGTLTTGFMEQDGRWIPDPEMREQLESVTRLPQGDSLVVIKETPWTSTYATDTAAERQLLESFFGQLIDKIQHVAAATTAPVHFYVWSHQEMKQLVEGCTRTSTALLGHLQELLGCREGLEQPIYSCLQQETDSRYALAWTGRDLTVVTSLKWFGQRYHWHRTINGQTIALDHAFRQDLFDYRRQFYVDDSGQWDASETGQKHTFETRLRMQKSLSAPYWRALWQTLPDPTTVESRIGKAIERYNIAQDRQILEAFLEARTHALRWVEERVRFKNTEMVKPPLDLQALAHFSLGIETVVASALDFLRLDHHIKVTNWLASNLTPPLYRVAAGRMLPLKDVHTDGKGLAGTIDYENYDLTPELLENNCTFEVGGFVRLAPAHADPARPQTLGQLTRGGSTCTIESLDFQTGRVTLSVIPTGKNRDHYTMSSWKPKDGFAYATLDESITDYVAGKVDKRLAGFPHTGAEPTVCQWFDLVAPQVPAYPALKAESLAAYRDFLATLKIPSPSGAYSLAPDQQQAVLEGLEARVQLLQGPPGTGKTETTSVATFLRILRSCSVGDTVIIAAPTHTAVDTLLHRLSEHLALLAEHAKSQDLFAPPITLLRLDSREPEQFQGTQVQCVTNGAAKRAIATAHKAGVAIIGTTTSAVLKFNDRQQPINATLLIVDEASMMVFPHFLALATLVNSPHAAIMLAGDHRQLSPIVAHDWEAEDRPPTVKYQPFVSAYDAVRRLETQDHQQIRCSALSYTFRLPATIRTLLDKLYCQDNIQLQGRLPKCSIAPDSIDCVWQHIWNCEEGLFLVTHSERESQSNNSLEVALIQDLLAAAPDPQTNSVAIVTPHRAQRSLLKLELEDYYGDGKMIGVIDTVEKLQGGERSTIIMSAAVSDPTAIANEVDFILGLNRSNVAFSRTIHRLIVVCAESLINYIPPDYEQYREAILWKTLRNTCTQELAQIAMNSHTVRVLQP